MRAEPAHDTACLLSAGMVEKFSPRAKLKCDGRRIEAEQLAKCRHVSAATLKILVRLPARVDFAQSDRAAALRFGEPRTDRPLGVSPVATIGEQRSQPIGKGSRGLQRRGEFAEFEMSV